MTLLLDDASVRLAFDWGLAVTALQQAYSRDVNDARFPARTMARGDQTWVRTLTGIPAASSLMGAKLIAVSLATSRASYLIPLYDQHSAELVALLDGGAVTGYRTAATSALAADILTVSGPLTVAVLGSGFEAKHHVRALAAVRTLKAVRVYSPRAESRARFAGDLADLPIVAATSPRDALTDADLVICAARSRDESPTLLGQWLRPGMTIVSIGSTLPEQREVDPEVLARADVLIADMVNEVCDDTGDFIAARDAGIDVAHKVRSLADVLSGASEGRTRDSQIVVYKSVGSAVQDLAVAGMCVENAQRLGLGTPMPVHFHPVQK